MATRSVNGLLTSVDSLFTTQQERDEANLKKIYDISISEIDDFPGHPYQVNDDEDMDRLVESIKERGIITPATVRKKDDGRYELISGHRRKRACELAELESLRCDVVDLTRDEAIVLMVESNYQRSNILPSEKAFAYKMRIEAMNRQGKRTDLTSRPLGEKLSVEEISEDSGDSARQIHRYIRLTNLVPELLEYIISSSTASKTVSVPTETVDPDGNITVTYTSATKTYLYITVTHKSTSDMATVYNFTSQQKEILNELLSEDYADLWSSVLYGITGGSKKLINVAITQIGNSGGQPYWSWYGFGSRVEWCACFVSWCANECGYIDAGIIPKFASCDVGMEWFKDHNRWQTNTYTPREGDIIFFDWDSDGYANHVGIVDKVENGKVHTIEGNSGDACKRLQYNSDDFRILGYGVPAY